MPPLDAVDGVLILAAGFAAGNINTIVGSGSLITFPVLLALGYPPIVANVSNTVGLVPGSVSGSIGYRRELRGQRNRIVRYGIVAVAGGLTGSLLLLTLPQASFEAVVPVLILTACALVIAQPYLTRRIRTRQSRRVDAPSEHPAAIPAIFGTSVYGGYFGAAQGVILMAVLGILIDDQMQRLNGLKNVLTAIVNGTAAVVFITASAVAWEAAILIALGATIGGQTGARLGRRLHPNALRASIVVVGVAVVALDLA
jgi:uncharacterized membrane protein YfcA